MSSAEDRPPADPEHVGSPTMRAIGVGMAQNNVNGLHAVALTIEYAPPIGLITVYLPADVAEATGENLRDFAAMVRAANNDAPAPAHPVSDGSARH